MDLKRVGGFCAAHAHVHDRRGCTCQANGPNCQRSLCLAPFAQARVWLERVNNSHKIIQTDNPLKLKTSALIAGPRLRKLQSGPPLAGG